MNFKKSLLRKKRKKESFFKYIMSVSHLWLGLLSSLVVFVVCLSGSLYSFKTQISDFINYDVVFNKDSDLSEWVNPDVVEQTFKDKGLQLNSITYPENFNRNIIATYTNTSEEYSGHFYLHPTTGKVIGKSSNSSAAFFDTMKSLHKNLLLGNVGNQIVGISVLIFVVLLISGLVLWFPSKMSRMKQGLTIKWSAKLPRVIYDLHNTLGFYTFLLLFFISITGLYISYPWVKSAVVVSLGGQPVLSSSNSDAIKSELSGKFASFFEESLENQKEKNKTSFVSLDALLNDANKRLPYEAIITITLPKNDDPNYYVKKINQENIFNAVLPDKVKYGKDGVFKKLELFSDKTLANQFMAISLPLHTGEIMGLTGVIIYFIVVLIGASMPITGFLIWYRKL